MILLGTSRPSCQALIEFISFASHERRLVLCTIECCSALPLRVKKQILFFFLCKMMIFRCATTWLVVPFVWGWIWIIYISTLVCVQILLALVVSTRGLIPTLVCCTWIYLRPSAVFIIEWFFHFRNFTHWQFNIVLPLHTATSIIDLILNILW
jgi:hypothetical protein